MGDRVERLNEKVGLARTRVKRYLRKGESGKIEDVGAYVRYMEGRYGGIPPGAMSPKQFEKEQAKAKTPGQKSSAQAELLRKQPSSQGKTGSTKKREDAAKEYRKKNPSPTFLGHDGAGNEIREGSRAGVIAGPDKGLTGVVRGIAKGGGVRIEVAGNLGKTREVLVDPDELRMKRR
jgi:hypothetical protein